MCDLINECHNQVPHANLCVYVLFLLLAIILFQMASFDPPPPPPPPCDPLLTPGASKMTFAWEIALGIKQL